MSALMIIAEGGSCHDGDFNKLMVLIDAAADAGATAFKVQYWSDPNLLADRRRVPEAYREIYRRYTLPVEWLLLAQERCHRRGLLSVVTTYLPGDVATAAARADVLKIASFEANADDLLLAHEPFCGGVSAVEPFRVAAPSLPLLISLGMGGTRTTHRLRARYLHCISAYPAPIDDLQLARLWWDSWREDQLDGFSDHSDPALTWTGALAVAAGAGIIEAHLRLYETDDRNPDAPHAMHPEQFRDYVRHIRFAERCRGLVMPGPDRAQPSEQPMAQYRVK